MDNLWKKHDIKYIWLVVEPTPLKNLKVNWDDELPNIWKNKNHVPNHQLVYVCVYRKYPI